MKKYIVWSPAVLLGLFLLWGSAVPARAATVLEDLENALMCKCDDKCGKVLINCNCDTSEKTRLHFKMQLESGLTIEQIIKINVDKYGESVLSSPTKKGFNLVAWITPFAAIAAGGLVIRRLIPAWVRKSGAAHGDRGKGPDKGDGDPALEKYSSRLNDELDKVDL